ncbi:hypothetical protein O6H91_09G064700 [Diphasiastrum complanatum]|uniref:Uncharacterized protein n=1 Tax=Diphasiastrum complanatum TaxID=34168 RepID=A0ACC2CPZ5_DIPCM|nr:hypothetical protein O6H91_09G064700 [Diphasiastrum complanatum]
MASEGDGQELQEILEEHYGASENSAFSIETFGDHLHHGYYENELQLDINGALNEDLATLAREAAVRLTDKIFLWTNIPDGCGRGPPQKMLDVGMGLGAVSRYFAHKLPHASVQGISVLKFEVEMATKLTAAENLSDKVSFLVADAQKLPFPDNEYDLVVCLECADHISDREQLMKELARVTAPGGQIVLTTLCKRDLLPHETSLSESEKENLENICDGLALAPWSPPSLYLKLAQEYGLQAIQSENWTKNVTLGLAICVQLYKNSNISEHIAEKNSIAYSALLTAYEQGLIEYFVFKAVKPSA